MNNDIKKIKAKENEVCNIIRQASDDLEGGGPFVFSTMGFDLDVLKINIAAQSSVYFTGTESSGTTQIINALIGSDTFINCSYKEIYVPSEICFGKKEDSATLIFHECPQKTEAMKFFTEDEENIIDESDSYIEIPYESYKERLVACLAKQKVGYIKALDNVFISLKTGNAIDDYVWFYRGTPLSVKQTKIAKEFEKNSKAVTVAFSMFDAIGDDGLNDIDIKKYSFNQRKDVFFLINRALSYSEENTKLIKERFTKLLSPVFADKNGVVDGELMKKRVFYVDSRTALCAREGSENFASVEGKIVTLPNDIESSGFTEYKSALCEYLFNYDNFRKECRKELREIKRIGKDIDFKYEKVTEYINSQKARLIELCSTDALQTVDGYIDELDETVKDYISFIGYHVADTVNEAYHKAMREIDKDVNCSADYLAELIENEFENRFLFSIKQKHIANDGYISKFNSLNIKITELSQLMDISLHKQVMGLIKILDPKALDIRMDISSGLLFLSLLYFGKVKDNTEKLFNINNDIQKEIAAGLFMAFIAERSADLVIEKFDGIMPGKWINENPEQAVCDVLENNYLEVIKPIINTCRQDYVRCKADEEAVQTVINELDAELDSIEKDFNANMQILNKAYEDIDKATSD